MRKLKEIARLSLELNLGARPIARACNVSTSTAHVYVDKLRELGFGYAEISGMDEAELYNRMFPKCGVPHTKALPDFGYLMGELKRKGVTLQLLHEEYKRDNPDGYERSQFYTLFGRWAKKADPVMRFTHKAGEKMFVDYSGDKLHYTDPATGEIKAAEFFVSALGASSYIFACATETQKTADFVSSNIKALEFYGGVPECIVPDNLKAGVTRACYYDPDINKAFAAMAEHYRVAVLPTRAAKPRDKAKVENAVLQAQRRILAALRNQTFFGIHELNQAVLKETHTLNVRPMTGIGKSRHELFVTIEKPALKPLPLERFAIASWKKAKVHIDYHVEVEKTCYSVPYTLIGNTVDIRYTDKTVEIYHNGKRVASHKAEHAPHIHFVTENLHMPNEHRQYMEWTPARIQEWGGKTGNNTKALMEAIMANRTHPEHGFRSCLGIIRLSKTYTPERVELACKRALDVKAYSYRSVKSILERGMDKIEEKEKAEQKTMPHHANIRGNAYYGEASHA